MEIVYSNPSRVQDSDRPRTDIVSASVEASDVQWSWGVVSQISGEGNISEISLICFKSKLFQFKENGTLESSANLRGRSDARPISTRFSFLFFMQFFENFGQIIGWYPPCFGTLKFIKSSIRH